MTSQLLSHESTPLDRTSGRFLRYATITARLLLGAMFFAFGMIGLLNLIPPPESGVPAGAMAFGAALAQTGYMMPLVKGTEVLGGALLLSNRFVPLALALLAPVVVNIFLFHLFLTPGDIAMAAVVLALEALLAWAYRDHYRGMLAPRAQPHA